VFVCVLKVVDEGAFVGVGGQSVRELSIRSSHVTDAHLPALLSLTKLRVLDIALNNKVTSVDQLLDALPSLEQLDASSAAVSSLGRVAYRVTSSTVRVLNLADNPLVDVATDALLGLTALEDLRLDGSTLTLDNSSFVSQRTSLRTLSLRRCNLTLSPWSAIARLGALQTLYMSQVHRSTYLLITKTIKVGGHPIKANRPNSDGCKLAPPLRIYSLLISTKERRHSCNDIYLL